MNFEFWKSKSFVDLFRPKCGAIVDFDLVSNLYMCWIPKVFNRVVSESKRQEVRIDKRFVVGYFEVPKYNRTDATYYGYSEREPLPTHEVMYTIGAKGHVKEPITDSHWIDLFIIRWPVLGAIAAAGFVCFALVLLGVKKLCGLFGLKILQDL